MCSIGEDDFGDEGAIHGMTPDTLTTGVAVGAGSCNKCGVTSENLYKLPYRAPECQECFLIYVRHKFRAALGAAKVLPRNAEVLLILDGSAESLVLLDMLHYAQTQNTFKRLHCNARVLYIDERWLREEHTPLINTLTELETHYKPFDFYVIRLGAARCALKKLAEYEEDSLEASDFSSKLKSLRSLTARQDFVRQQRKRLIASAAEELQCGYVFEASISTDLATQLLTAIALGRGGSAALDVAFMDDRMQGGVKLLRPLRDVNDQEVQLYVRIQNLKPLLPAGVQHYGYKQGKTASLQNLTNAFVTNLQQNYASTVSTVFRTGDKIAPKHYTKPNELDGLCLHCQSPLDCAFSETLLAIEYSRVMSEAGAARDRCQEELETCAREQLTAAEQLCHACRNIQAELSSGTLLLH